MHFQIYIPGVQGCATEHLEQVGLATLAAGANFVGCDKGPDGRSGSVVFWKHTGPGTLGYRPDAQDWEAAIADDGLPAERYWIGFTRDANPTPEELQRPYRQPGESLELGDGRAWLLPQLHKEQKLADADFSTGMFRIFRGLFKKIVIADSLSIFVDMVFADPGSFSGVSCWIALYAYAFQIYMDFSGYTDVAIGAGWMLGLRMTENFNLPYLRQLSQFRLQRACGQISPASRERCAAVEGRQHLLRHVRADL